MNGEKLSRKDFGPLESEVMEVVWRAGRPVAVREVVDDLNESRSEPLAYTTVMTVMDNLHRKGWLSRERDGKAYRYTAVAGRAEYTAGLMREALAGASDTEAVLSHFIATMDGTESAALRAVLEKLGGDPA